jgi:hypothetical protein
MTTVDINGVKIDVDLREAKSLCTVKVGTRVKVLHNNAYDNHIYPGVVVGFEQFPSLPTIVVAFLENKYGKAELKMISFNDKTKDYEMIVSEDDGTAMEVDRAYVMKNFQTAINTKLAEIAAIEDNMKYFNDKFGEYFTPVKLPSTEDAT